MLRTDPPAVAIVGSGVAGALIAYLLTARGHRVQIFERGPAYPYPHTQQFKDRFLHRHDNPAYLLPGDLQGLTVSGSYRRDLDHERHMVIGGSATHWGGIALRMLPEDFQTKTRYGFGDDWPIGYDELEPYYGRAEALLGVSGTDADNPFAPRRSQPFPLPPFELSYEDRFLARQLAAGGIVLHTTPQAATRTVYGDRPGCANYGACDVCPTGARYPPTYHLARAVATGRCAIHRETSVRRIVADRAGRHAASLVYRDTRAGGDREARAPVIVLAGGAIENARLLLLSSRDRHPADGVPLRDVVGRRLSFHHLWSGRLRYASRMLPGRLGRWTGQSQQFLRPPTRGRHGGVKVELTANVTGWSAADAAGARNGAEILARFAPATMERTLTLHSEAAPDARRTVALSGAHDRFGDPYAHVHYELGQFDEATYAYGRSLFERFATATAAVDARLEGIETVYSGGHHMGTCRIGGETDGSAADSFGALHDCRNLYVVGGSMFVGPAAVNPTLTIAALAVRTADHLARAL